MLSIPKIEASTWDEASEKMSAVEASEIKQINWPDDFPYAPKVTFKAAHNGKILFLDFHVDEEVTMAQVAEDNGEVWTDSAVEFFVTFDDKGYYNFEFNCIGKALLGFRKVKPEAVHADPAVMEMIRREPSLGGEPFVEKNIKGGWDLKVGIPMEAFFGHSFKTLDGLHARGNFYKCGDNLSKPHFLSWTPIDTAKPNFHMPEFFGRLIFEKI